MVIGLRIVATTIGLLAIVATANAQQTSDPRVADLVAAGQVRFGTFPPQYTKNAATGELRGRGWRSCARSEPTWGSLPYSWK
jgi:hypothetical protein